MAFLAQSLNNRIQGEVKDPSPFLFPLSMAAAGDDKKSYDKKPDIIVFKKVAKTVVHIYAPFLPCQAISI